jgi:predicted RNA polymerase sigma factor
LITVAAHRLTDLLRSEQARRRREDTVARWQVLGQQTGAAERPDNSDDTLILLFMCCHPALSPLSQIALTLRAVGGLTTAEVARAFLVSEATMTRRISRAKQQIKDSGVPFRLPARAERAERFAVVLHVLYLIFTEGHAATSGGSLYRVELSTEAIRLTRLVHQLVPADAEVSGLLALMLLTDARRHARTTANGELVPLADQDRALWDADKIAEGVALITAALPRGTAGPYQLQAAIAAIHDEAPSAAETDWPQIKALYEVLLQISNNPVIALNHAVAVAMADGPISGLQRLETLATDKQLAEDHRLYAVRAHLLEMSGETAAACEAYRAAARRARNLPQQRYLIGRATRLLDH